MRNNNIDIQYQLTNAGSQRCPSSIGLTSDCFRLSSGRIKGKSRIALVTTQNMSFRLLSPETFVLTLSKSYSRAEIQEIKVLEYCGPVLRTKREMIRVYKA